MSPNGYNAKHLNSRKITWRGQHPCATTLINIGLQTTKVSVESDSNLIKRIQLGDDDAATALFHRYAVRIRGLAHKQTSPELRLRFDDDDVMQSVFRTFFRRVARGSYNLPDGDELWGLLLVITLNKVRALAGRHRAVRRSVQSTSPLTHHDIQFPSTGNHDQQSAAMLVLTLREFADELTPDERTILDLRMQGFGVTEIASQCGRTRRTVERILQKLRHSLRKRLDD